MADETPVSEAERLSPEERIDQDDPRYAGYRLRSLWLATVVGPDDQEALVAVGLEQAARFHLEVGPALAGDERRLLHLREFAAWAAATHGVEVRVRRFAQDAEDEVFAPGGEVT